MLTEHEYRRLDYPPPVSCFSLIILGSVQSARPMTSIHHLFVREDSILGEAELRLGMLISE